MGVVGPRGKNLTSGWCRPFKSARVGVPRGGSGALGGLGPRVGPAAQPQAVRHGAGGIGGNEQAGRGMIGPGAKGGLGAREGGAVPGAKGGRWGEGRGSDLRASGGLVGRE